MFFSSKKSPFTNERPIFDAEFCSREFKSYLFLSEEFIAWLNVKKYHFNDEFEILARKFVQIEYFLHVVEMNSFVSAKKGGILDYLMKHNEGDMIDIVQTNPSMQWRDLLRQAISNHELTCYDYLSRLPVQNLAPLQAAPSDLESKNAHDSDVPPAVVYPWGTHSTKLLEQLSQAATKFWTLYDPADPSTAPTNEQVEEWLVGQLVPKRTAEIMATILRADGLKRGPRK